MMCWSGKVSTSKTILHKSPVNLLKDGEPSREFQSIIVDCTIGGKTVKRRFDLFGRIAGCYAVPPHFIPLFNISLNPLQHPIRNFTEYQIIHTGPRIKIARIKVGSQAKPGRSEKSSMKFLLFVDHISLIIDIVKKIIQGLLPKEFNVGRYYLWWIISSASCLSITHPNKPVAWI